LVLAWSSAVGHGQKDINSTEFGGRTD
jgi:hypothetical protein